LNSQLPLALARVNSAARRLMILTENRTGASQERVNVGTTFPGGITMRQNLILIPAALLIIGVISANAQRPAPKIGDAAPALNLNKILEANENRAVSLKDLKGNVVVLEFWATWCVPCIPALNHFNELSEKFKGKPVRFISITDEDESKIAQFVKTQPIRTWIGFDPTRAAFDAYQANGIPHTVVVDRNGRIAAITKPENVTETVLNDLLAGKSVSLPLKESIASNLDWDQDVTLDQTKPLMQVIIKPSNASTGGVKTQSGHVSADGAVLMNLIEAAYQTSPIRIVNNLPESSEQYRVSVIVPPGRESALYPLFQQALTTTFGINVRREMRETDVIVLTVLPGKVAKLQPSLAKEQGLAMTARGRIRTIKWPIRALVESLENILGRPVIDKTGLAGEYDWDLPYSRVDKTLLLNAVREKLGLEITEMKQPIEMLIVDSATIRK
jgi:uncharacterized protein (TIGR03435 family)